MKILFYNKLIFNALYIFLFAKIHFKQCKAHSDVLAYNLFIIW